MTDGRSESRRRKKGSQLDKGRWRAGTSRVFEQASVAAALGPRRDTLLTIDNVPTGDLRTPAL